MIKHLSYSAIEQEYDKISYDMRDLTNEVQHRLNPVVQGQKTYDYAGVLSNGLNWLLEKMKIYQPKTFQTIDKSAPTLLVGERLWKDRLDPNKMHWSANAFLRLEDRYIVVHPYFSDSTIEVLKEKHPCFMRYSALPRPIADSYYLRVDGFELVHQLPVNAMESRVLPAKISAWARVGVLCKKDKKSKDTMRSVLVQISDTDSTGSEELEDKFKIIIDTRQQDNYEASGDFLIVQVDSKKGRFFHIKDGDFHKIRLIKDPVRLMDDYVSYVLSAEYEKFDFMPYGDAFF